MAHAPESPVSNYSLTPGGEQLQAALAIGAWTNRARFVHAGFAFLTQFAATIYNAPQVFTSFPRLSIAIGSYLVANP